MTTYLYQCPKCGEFEAEHPMSEVLEECPTCGDGVRRLIYCAPRFILKGHCWSGDGYLTNGIHDTNVER